MQTERDGKQKAKEYYDQGAKSYIKQYQAGYKEYPANAIRTDVIVDRLKKNKVKSVLDVGCGTCGPMIRLLNEGFNVIGFDFSKEMVEQGKRELQKAGYSPDLIFLADLEARPKLSGKKFDAAIALGVFPHILDEKTALVNMAKALKPKGLVFIEFRNELFAAYTLNTYSLDFFLNTLIDLPSLPKKFRDKVMQFYTDRLHLEMPKRKKEGTLSYKDILAKFRNPLTIEKELFAPSHFVVAGTHFYHYHAVPPIFEQSHPRIFRELSLKMERPNDWRGHLMASAYVVEARKTNT